MPSDLCRLFAARLFRAACLFVLAGLSGCGVLLTAELAVVGVAAVSSAVTPKPPEQTKLAARAYWQRADVICPELTLALEQGGRKLIDADPASRVSRFSFPAPDTPGAAGGTLRAICTAFGGTTIVTLLGTGTPLDETERQAAAQLLDELEATLGARGIRAGPPHQTNTLTLPVDAAAVYAALVQTLESDGRTIVERDPAGGTLRVSYPFSLLHNNWGGMLTIACIAHGPDTVVTITSDAHDADTRVALIGDEILAALTKALQQSPRSP